MRPPGFRKRNCARCNLADSHPHFLFNALNTLYGIIPREAKGARETVLNLADILRYFLETGKTFLPLELVVHIIKAYIEVEKLRLGEKLHIEIDVDPVRYCACPFRFSPLSRWSKTP